MNKNSVILVVSLAIFLIIAISPVNNLVKLAVMALALIVIIWSRRATFYFVTANKNYTSKDPEKRKKSIDGFKKALQLGGLPDNYTISAASLLIQNGEADVVVLDEINIALDLNMIDEKDVIETIKNKPKNVEIVMTGRNAHKSVIDVADLVSEIKEVKHYYNKGVMAREGIEY